MALLKTAIATLELTNRALLALAQVVESVAYVELGLISLMWQEAQVDRHGPIKREIYDMEKVCTSADTVENQMITTHFV